MTRIALVGMACRYPDAISPRELWENALAGRRAFRRLPDVRMRLDDYWDADPATPDRFYARNAAVIEGYEFDRIAYKIAGSTYRSTDLTHWLALDIAALALADAGFPMAEGLPRERTGVVVGNTLTGEFTRANQLRLRWPYVRRVVAAALREQQWDDDRLAALLDDLEVRYKSSFPVVDEDTLAGALSNTIAGRICNYFDLNGGGYTVDGACSSSLLSVATACAALIGNDIDVAIAGGVDLSIDPFEIIGFAKTGALATGEMRVYDRSSNGFWPGEGCGMVVLMREADARAAGHRIYATIAGWGISSDGKGGITRPEISGYRLALRRAYERAGFGIDTVAMFEGHGTGTKVGDATELLALSGARTAADPTAAPAAVSSVKAMIGHTKAAAGVAGLIKATMAVYHQVLPPTVGCVEPHEAFTDVSGVRMLRKAEAWPPDQPVRAGITAMGFGGINTHIVLEGAGGRRASGLDARTRALAASVQDAELLLVEGASTADLHARLSSLAEFVPTLAYAQLADLSATLYQQLRGLPYRAAVVAGTPDEARSRLLRICAALDAGETTLHAPDDGSFLGTAQGPGRVGYLFPGQGSGRGTSGGALRRRFAEVEEVYLRANLPTGGDVVATQVAQPRIVTGAMAGLRALSLLGIEATVAIGHSLGEIAALHWAGAMDEQTLLRVAAMRGRTMSEHSSSGTMAGIAAGPELVAKFVADHLVVIAGYNGPHQTVVAGTAAAVEEVCQLATAGGMSATPLPVSHAFHSPLVADAADAFAGVLSGESFSPPARRVVSTVYGRVLTAQDDVVELLRRQITEPVLFGQALALGAKDVDLFVEVGPGRVLSGLAAGVSEIPAVALDTDDESLASLLRVVGAAFVTGASHGLEALYHGRLIRPLQLDAVFSFFTNPCETAPVLQLRRPDAQNTDILAGPDTQNTGLPAGPGSRHDNDAGPDPAARAVASPVQTDVTESTVDLLRRLAAARAELPVEMVRPDSRLLDELHLSSITVGQLVNAAAQHVGVATVAAPTNFASATIGELADALDVLASTDRPDQAPTRSAAGVADWVRSWSVELDEVPIPPAAAALSTGAWQVYVGGNDLLAEPLQRALDDAGLGGGVLVCIPQDSTVDHLEYALAGAVAAASGRYGDRYVLVDHGRGAAGLARTLYLEAPQLRVTVVHVQPGEQTVHQAVGQVVAEVAATTGFVEAHYGPDAVRRVPTLHALPLRPATASQPLDATDVLLVTGGGKGITAECALAMATDSGARLAVLGRSDPATDSELAANLARMAQSGITVRYLRADVTDAQQVREAVSKVRAEFGPVTAVLHGAGRNEPAALPSLDMAAFRRTFAPKVDGLAAVLAAIDPNRLRLLVTFGSIIGRTGLRGEAHYATANDWLAGLTRDVADRYPQCRALCLEWSVWSGVGMGERLSVVESLARDGITPVSPDRGVEILRQLLADSDTPPVVVVSGRTEGIGTVRYHEPALPLLRFLERPLVRYHGVELVTEVQLSAGTDRYLADHVLDGNALLPAVFGLEAMAQVAMAVTGVTTVPVFEAVRFLRPVVVPPGGATTIRIAALVVDDRVVDLVIRSSETSFSVEHFAARVRLTGWVPPAGPPDECEPGLPAVPLHPGTDLYGDLLFQGERFQRLRSYHRAAARDVDADVAVVDGVEWFAGYLPDELLLGDPGVRDALMHGNQVCVPDATLLPAGIDRLYAAGPRLSGSTVMRYCATERSRDGDTYVYDVALRDAAGEVVERWEGLRLQAVRKRAGTGPWVPPLLGPYLERSVGDLTGARLAVAVEPDPPGGSATGQKESDVDARTIRAGYTTLAAGRAAGHPVTLSHRPDGKPEIDEADLAVSAAHGTGLTLCVVGPDPIGCDLQAVTARPWDEWVGLLGEHAELAGLVASAEGEDADTAATRVWCAMECLQKAGRSTRGPLVLHPSQRTGWTLFALGELRVATLATTVRGRPEPVVFAVLTSQVG